MSFYIDTEKIILKDLQKRIEETDLVPSRISLLDNLKDNFNKLKKQGISTLSNLRYEMKTSSKVASLAKSSGVDINYLTLLKREIEGYFPKPQKLQSFDIFNTKIITKLEANKMKNSILLYVAINTPKKRSDLSKSYQIDIRLIESMYCLIGLTRIRWVSPLAAKMLILAGYDNPKKVAKANYNDLYASLDKTNKENKCFKGTIGIRDIKRLIKEASYIN